jgi:hypothetical protein
MNIRTSLASAASVAAIGLFFATSASAQATRTWVSGVGDDANPCSRTAPCKTFAGAISKTAAGGEISVLDPGGFGGVTITKSISINGEWAGEAGVLVSGTNGIIINALSTDVVNLRGLFVEGLRNSASLSGVNIISAAEVHMQDMVIRDFRSSANANVGNGVLVNPGANNVKVSIDNSLIANNGTATSGAGVLVRPTAGAATAQVVITRSTFQGNSLGVRADNSGGGSGAIKVQISDSTASASIAHGFVAVSTAAPSIQMFIDNSTSVNNGGAGAKVDGANATMTIGRSSFSGNTGAGMLSANSGVLNSFRDNHSNLNGAVDSTTVQVFPN